MDEEKHADCIIIGAGISGLDAAYHLQRHCKWADYVILERRDNLGGTWDFFKYPGIRSDSDMYTFGFSWKIWRSAKPIAPAEEIMKYLKEAAEEQGIVNRIKFNTNVNAASFRSSDNRWHLVTSEGLKYSCSMLFCCAGHFSYDTPHEPKFPGQENFPGPIVHPQKWEPRHDEILAGKKVALIGSGATAVTILPSIAESVAHVTMVQRTPTYIMGRPLIDPLAEFLNKWLPAWLAVKINRWRALLRTALFYQFCVRFPGRAKRLIKRGMYEQVEGVLSEEEFERHFSPPYNPWQQRLCLAPANDFFGAIRSGKATVCTGQIDHITEKGIRMEGGEHVDADFIISATGFTLQQNYPFSTIKASVDGEDYKAGEHVLYNGIMISDVPNMAFVMGYTNASWTLKADIASLYFTKLLNHMRDNNVVRVVPRRDPNDDGVKVEDISGGRLTSGYLARAADVMPKQGDRFPWRGGVDYITDLIHVTFGGLKQDSLEFTIGTDKN